MALILQIETSTVTCSVALAEDGNTIAIKELSERNIHASSITLFIDDVMQQANRPFSELNAVAVSMGPGSYTGLRIGVSAAKGLCYALDIPLISINTLASMASGMLNRQPDTDLLLCPMVDARRMEVYTAVFDRDLQEIRATTAKIIDENSFSDLLSEHRLLFFGDGAPKCRPVLCGSPNALFDEHFVNSASHMTVPVYRKFLGKQFEDTAYFEPCYLKDFIAGISRK